MALIDDVKQICHRLAQHGWKELLLQHRLDLTAQGLKRELGKELPNINRRLKGFEDFAHEGKRGIEPSHPTRSLLFHAFASPNVIEAPNGTHLGSFTTFADIDLIENYVYGANPPSVEDLRIRAKHLSGDDNPILALCIFSSEYRPGLETVHQKHADKCFSRTGVCRVGTAEALYVPEVRGFLPFVDGDPYTIRVLPAYYSLYVAVQLKGNREVFGPMRFNAGHKREPQYYPDDDATLLFWVPLHKLFSGSECIRESTLNVALKAHHLNEKIRRIHVELKKSRRSGWDKPHIDQAPFTFTDGIAQFATTRSFGSNLLVPVHHPRLIEQASYQGRPLTFQVPPVTDLELGPSLNIPDKGGARHAPEYVHVRTEVKDGRDYDLNNEPDLEAKVRRGGYQARHYVDYTGDGWIDGFCPELAFKIPRKVPAYSLVTAPDFSFNCDQRELMDWWEQSVPTKLKKNLWPKNPGPPFPLSDGRIAANLQLKDADFRAEDRTVTAIVSLPVTEPEEQMLLDCPPSARHEYLPDAASGIFAPGWDVSFDRTDKTDHLAAYGLGSPFPEDAKICAALSSYWPTVAPDASRTYQPTWPTVIPLPDEEMGMTGKPAWDGMKGPRVVRQGSDDYVEYPSFAHVDYVMAALHNKFSLDVTGRVDLSEHGSRICRFILDSIFSVQCSSKRITR
jgi:hypothetical protein